MSDAPGELHDVVLADDDADDQFMIRRALCRCCPGLAVHGVRDGLELMDYLQHRSPALLPRLVLLDLNMPRMDGREALRALRADPRLYGLSVVVLTTSVQKSDQLGVTALGASDFVSKPDGFVELCDSLKRTLNTWMRPLTVPS
ncbi:MAG: response regulator [Panacagrimonas sp.]